MELTMDYCKSSIGKKLMMAVTGLIWTGFVAGHMAGNMLIFVSADAYNSYGHAITNNRAVYYGIETVLLLSLVTHVVMAFLLSKENWDARPVGYAFQAQGVKRATLASQTMKYTGAIVLFFVVWHLNAFRFGPVYMTTVNGVEMRDLYKLMTEAFSSPLYVLGYAVSLGLLGFHLKHGVQAAFQSLGFRHPKYTPWIKCGAVAYAVIVALGFISQPLYVFFMARN